MSRVRRIDVGELAKPVKRADGTMIVQAKLARTGVQVYSNPDGTPRREYRPATNVFDQSSIDSFKLVPFTNNHPPEMITADNARQYTVGAVGQDVHQDGKWLVGSIAIHDAATIKDLESGKDQISNGYDCDLEMTPGVSPDGERYDAVQTNISGNHVALVWNARAGQEAAVRMDAAAATEGVVMDTELKKACEDRGTRYDANDERGSALALLAKLGHQATEKTPNGQTLSQRTDEYVKQRAVGAANYILYSNPDRFATNEEHFDGERTDGAPYVDDNGYLVDPRRDAAAETDPEYDLMVKRNQRAWIESATPSGVRADQLQDFRDELQKRTELDQKLQQQTLENMRKANGANRADTTPGTAAEAYEANRADRMKVGR